jgi:hypothetical protein
MRMIHNRVLLSYAMVPPHLLRRWMLQDFTPSDACILKSAYANHRHNAFVSNVPYCRFLKTNTEDACVVNF